VLWVLNQQHTHWLCMDPKMLTVELCKAGVQPKFARLLRTCRG